MLPRARTVVILLSLLVLLLGSACVTATPRLPAEPAGITGEITSMPEGTQPPFTILVEGGKQPEGAVSDKASVTISEKTVVVGPNGNRVEADALREGAAVKVWFEGPVAESYPVQGGAGYVQLTK